MAEPRPSIRILVVEDDDAIAFGLRTNLAFEGYQVQTAASRAEAVEPARAPTPPGHACAAIARSGPSGPSASTRRPAPTWSASDAAPWTWPRASCASTASP